MRRPERNEAAEYYFTYIDRVPGADVLAVLEEQLETTLAFLGSVPEQRSLYRYAPDKWSIREVVSHLNDTERVFTYRALWFARGFDTPLPSFDEKASGVSAEADRINLAGHLDEFRAIRLATLSLFRHLPEAAWARTGTASGNPFSVRALAFITAGHVIHHLGVLRERYG
jgi:hypothetical protein